MKVKELMTKDPAICTLDTSLHDVAQLMVENDCGCIPVVDTVDSRAPIGMITDRDITIRTVAHNKNPLNMIAGEVMSDGVISVAKNDDLEHCCTTMERNQVRRLAVVDENGDLCGIVAQADVARAASQNLTAEVVRNVSARTTSMAA